MQYQLSTSNLTLTAKDNGSWTLWDSTRNERLILVPQTACLRPIFSETTTHNISITLEQIRHNADSIEWDFAVPGCRNFTARIEVENDTFIFSSRFTPEAPLSLSRLEILPPGTGLNLYDVVNFRNRHYSPQTWPELPLGGERCQTTTYSNDWQFAPHPSLFVFRKNTRHLLLGALDISASFGLHLAARENRIQELFLDFGPAPYGLPLEAGVEWTSPRFILRGNENEDVHETIALYSDELMARGLIADPKHRTRFEWHRAPLYFTWIDQEYRADARPVASLNDQAEAMEDEHHPLLRAMDEKFVREVAETIQRENLPIRTLLLDDGWQVARGQWEPHPLRFRDLRGLVNDLHAQDFKVAFWWSWAEILDSAVVDPETLLRNADGTPWRNKHGARVRDYSHPATQRYLSDFFHTMFSSEAGCYDFDGVKTDFLADKVHPDMPLFDASWRGEENYMLRLTKLFFEAMRQHKNDACHIGCAGHPYLAQFIDINRTYDVFSSDAREHEARARMLQATTPGVLIAFDSHNFVEGYLDYFSRAARVGHSVQISNVLGQKRDSLAEWEEADMAFYDLLRQGLRTQDFTL